MGLLDDPNVLAQLQLGAGLLGGGNFGQALNRGLTGYQGTLDAASDRKAKQAYLQSQIDENATQNAIRQSTLARQAKQDAYFFGGAPAGGAGQSTGAAPMNSGAGTPVSGSAPASAVTASGKFDEWSQQFGIPKDALIADYLNNGGKGIAEMLAKRGTPDMQVSNGYAYDKNRLGAGYLPSLSTSQDGKTSMVQIGPNGMPVISAPTGALDTFNSYQGAQAAFKPIKVFNPATQREEFTSEAAAVGRQPTPMSGASGNVQSSAYSGGDRNSANLESIRMIQSEMQKPGNSPADTAAMQREIQRLQMQSGITNAQLPQGGVAAGPSASEATAAEAERARTVGQVKADIIPAADKQKALNSGNDALKTIEKALNHPGLSQGTGLQGTIDPRNYIPGTNARDFAAVREQLQGQTFLQAYNSLKGGGQITEIEGKKAEKAIARLDKAQSTEEYKAALTDLRDVVDRGLKLTRGGKVPDASASDKKDESQKGNILDSLPVANASNKGKRIRDTTTGKILMSNGIQWKEE